MIKPLLTKAQKLEARRGNIINHINLLEARYSESERKVAINLLQARLTSIEMQERSEADKN